ncbi:MAG TPA: hypothetical protein VN222_13755, partial [Novosphingobium sp.]|nr:hypothetical protein [Novosphingobium sp.]
DPHALTAGADCTDPARDFAGNHTDPYAVDLGDGARLIVADFAAIGEKALTDEAAMARYRGDAAMIARLAQGGRGVFVTEHPPLGGVVIGKKHGKLDVGYAPVGQAFDVATRVPELPGVTGVISGHVHLLQVVARDGYPVQVINGFSGTAEEEPRAPATLAELRALSDGAGYRDIATLFGRFGFGVMERMAGGRWRYTARDVEGRVMLSRVIEPR